MRAITDYSDFQILDLFDLLGMSSMTSLRISTNSKDISESGKIQFLHFFVFFCGLTARREKKLTLYLFLYGRQLFTILGRGKESITFQQFCGLGLIFGVPQHMILHALQDQDVKTTSEINFDEFDVLFYILASTFDKNQLEGDNVSVGEKSDCIIS
jgi:hypothetical protein